jgi:hypothetical protein
MLLRTGVVGLLARIGIVEMISGNLSWVASTQLANLTGPGFRTDQLAAELS